MSRHVKSHGKSCEWPGENPLMVAYHDKEWGVPIHDDKKLFEFLILEGAQAGLTWQTVLNKRENYRKAFSNFDARKIARFKAEDVKRLLRNSGIIRNRLKIAATIENAKRFLQVQKEFGSFDTYIWQFVTPRQTRGNRERSRTVGGKPIDNKIKSMKEIPARTKESDAMSKEMLSRGFKFVGSTICYAFMQAVGMVNDHSKDCFRYNAVKSRY